MSGHQIPSDFFISHGPPSKEQIVLTSSFKLARGRVDIDLESKMGKIRLVVGQRGIGKSTCLQFLHSHVVERMGAGHSTVFDAGIHIPQLLTIPEIDGRIALILKELAKSISRGRFDSIAEVIGHVDSAGGGPYFLFIDNLDRFYQGEDDRRFVSTFFRSADPVLKALTRHIVVVFSCAPEWEAFLRDEDLSYLNFPNRISLEPLTEAEVGALLDQRIESLGLQRDQLFARDLVPPLRVASRGNARAVFQFLELVANDPSTAGAPINGETFKRIIRSELFDAAIEGLHQLTTKSPNLSWGVNQLWRFFDSLQKTGGDASLAIRIVSLACNQGTIRNSDVEPLGSAWWRIAHRFGPEVSALNPQARNVVLEWSRQTGIDRETLLTAFSERPFTTATTDVEGYAEEFREALRPYPEGAAAFERSVELYLRINTKQAEGWERSALVQDGWGCIQNFAQAVLAIRDRRFSTELQAELKAPQTADTASRTLLARIDEIYRSMQKVNPYRAEVVSILERHKDVVSDSTSVKYWESQQLVEFRRQVLGAFEGLVRGLRPLRVRMGSDEEVDSIIRNLATIEESKKFELKSAARWDVRKDKRNDEIEQAFLRTIVGFLNAEGGILLVGVGPDKRVIGLSNDYSTLKDRNRDGFERYVLDQVSSALGPAVTSQIEVHFRQLGGQEIAAISIAPFPEPVYLNREGKSEFWVRVGNSTRRLEMADAGRYIRLHWTLPPR